MPRKKKSEKYSPKAKKLIKEIRKVEEQEYGTKEFIHGILIGLVVGFIIGILIFQGGL